MNTFRNIFAKRKITNKKETEGYHQFIGVVSIIFLLILYAITYLLATIKQDQLLIRDEKNFPDSFIGERAQSYLKKLTDVGSRVTGSKENEIDAVNLLSSEIENIIEKAHQSKKIEKDIQESSGKYHYESREPYKYEKVQNVIAKLYGSGDSKTGIVLNAHFDNVPSSPGAGDDGFMCSIIMEILHKLATSSEPLYHDIIFLFNGAEEAGLLGSHGFVTNHIWFEDAKIIINLDVAGSSGREILFQTGPYSSWLMKYYSKLKYPHAQTAGEEVFQSGLIPSDTDFRVFMESKKVFGYDIAIAGNGYHYHTRFDNFSIILPSTYQHVGSNILNLVKEIAKDENLIENFDDEGKSIFYDFLGLFVIVYSEKSGIIINISVVIVSLLLALIEFYNSLTLRFPLEYVKFFGILFSCTLLGWLIALGFTLLIGCFLDLISFTMSWFNNSWIIFFLYCPPIIIILYLSIMCINKLFSKVCISNSVKAKIQCSAIRFLWTLILLIGIIAEIKSMYIIMIPIFFNCIGFVLIIIFSKIIPERFWAHIYVTSMIIPTIFTMYFAYIVLSIFIPIMGRNGGGSNPEIFVGGITYLITMLATTYYIPLAVTIVRKPQFSTIILFFMFIIGLIFVFTPLGFPYSENLNYPIPQRQTVYHVNRLFHGKNGSLTYTDSGYYLIKHDRNTQKFLKDYIGDMNDNTRKISDICKSVLYCGLPVSSSQTLKSLNKNTWITAKNAVIKDPVELRLRSNQSIDNFIRYEFSLKGPDRMSLSLSPRIGSEIIATSLLEKIPTNPTTWNEQKVYLINLVYGKHLDEYIFTVDIQSSGNLSNLSFEIGVVGRYIHKNENTLEFENFLSNFPKYTTLTQGLAMFVSYVY